MDINHYGFEYRVTHQGGAVGVSYGDTVKIGDGVRVSGVDDERHIVLRTTRCANAFGEALVDEFEEGQGEECLAWRDWEIVGEGLVACHPSEYLIGALFQCIFDNDGVRASELAFQPQSVEQPSPEPECVVFYFISWFVASIGIENFGHREYFSAPPIKGHQINQIDQITGDGCELIDDARVGSVGQGPGVVITDPALRQSIRYLAQVDPEFVRRFDPYTSRPARQSRLSGEPRSGSHPEIRVRRPTSVKLTEHPNRHGIQRPAEGFNPQRGATQVYVANTSDIDTHSDRQRIHHAGQTKRIRRRIDIAEDATKATVTCV